MVKKIKRKIFLTNIFAFLSLISFAQISIKGVVKDSSGQPLPGVSVRVKGTSVGAAISPDGVYLISAPANSTLTFSFVGYNTQEITVNNRNEINVTLVDAPSSNLDDVVVVGYGTQKKVNLSGAVNTVNTKAIVNRPVTSLINALQGTVPGMAIKSTPGDVGADLGSINVRGRGNLGASEPLYVVDGVIVPSGDFARINSNDVENISVLKDASSSSIYGSRAAYGVILVTTKKGSGAAKVTYNAYYGNQTALYLPDFVGAYDYAVLRNEAAANAGKSAVYSATVLDVIKNQSDPDRYPDNDWFALTLKKNAPMMEHQLNISGGEKTRYYLSGAYFTQNSLIPGKDLKRYSLRTNIETQVSEKFKISTNLSFVRDGFDNEKGAVNFTTLSRETPLLVAKQSNGQWGSVNGGIIDATLARDNTLRKLEEGGRNSYNTNRFIGNLNGTYTPVKGLEIGGLFSYNFYNTLNSEFINTMNPINNFFTGLPIASTAVTTNQLTESWENTGRMLAQATANYEKTVGKHYFKALVGASYENYNNRTISTIRKNFVNNDLNAINGGSQLPENTTASGGIQQRAFASVFGRLNYSFNDTYLLEASLRNDASSQFAPGNRSGLYPSFSAAWRISKESFMQDVKAVNELKLRLSYGKLGNINNVGNYDFYDGLNTGTVVILDETKQDGVYPGKIFNSLLSWEKVDMYNAGLDATLFKSFNFQLDVFNRLTEDILLENPNIPSEAGLVSNSTTKEAPSVNLGKVRNSGFELSLSYNGKVNDFTYSIGGNVSKIWNKVVDLGGTNETPPSGYYINRVGQAIGSFYMYQSDGLFSSNAEVASHAFQSTATKAGDIKYVDQNGDKKIDGNDRVITGNDVPYFIYGINFTANYKNFDLSVLGQGVNDVKVYLENEASQAFFNSAGAKSYVLDRWTAANPNPNAVYPRVLSSADNSQNLVQSDFWLFNADYFRVKTIALGYSLPKKVLDKLKIGGLRVYASSNNPFTIRGDKRLKDFDPETPSARASYPTLKTYSFGINLTL
ncbi:SusC/RagA family TonB-linked outer membrane protein [Pedobacter jejuensis]|uniref:TonB-dependent receptor n=1 Tax=Pedobacter jejuensis TaxID=1268550 RepID=A0A3N0BX04_9SPHI|nr:TonB-dependent receptor [Pedobacter jejuensis]RNL54249.1 TonB-dependent receptor [Pedobacter jejuensis]